MIGSKGDYIILDRRTGELLPMPIYPVPSNTYMGIHVTNTTDGNVIIGPNAETTDNFTYYGVPQENMDYLAESASEIWPYIRKADYIRNYSGICLLYTSNDRSGTGITYDERTDRQCGEDPGNPLHDLGGPGGPVLSVPSIFPGDPQNLSLIHILLAALSREVFLEMVDALLEGNILIMVADLSLCGRSIDRLREFIGFL